MGTRKRRETQSAAITRFSELGVWIADEKQVKHQIVTWFPPSFNCEIVDTIAYEKKLEFLSPCEYDDEYMTMWKKYYL